MNGVKLDNYPYPIIAREGWIYLGIAVAVAIVTSRYSAALSIPAWIAALFMLQFFRDPARSVPKKANAVLSPADGRIVVVEKAQDAYAGREALKISVFMNVFNVHSNRSPVDGKVQEVCHFPREVVYADRDKRPSKQNERNAVIIATSTGQIVTCVQMAGMIARRILCYVSGGESVVRGQRYGFIRFGSRVDVYLPLNARPKVTVGDKVLASETILAEL